MIRVQKYLVWFISAALVTAGVIYAIRSFNQTVPEVDKELAACLKSKTLKFYGTYSCTNCTQQKKILDGYLSSVLYIECTQNPVLCQKANVQRVPTWEFLDGSRHEGVLQLNDLFQRIGCVASTSPETIVEP